MTSAQLQGNLNNTNGRIDANTLLAYLDGNLDNTLGQIQIAGLSSLTVSGDLINDSGLISAGALDLSVGGSLYNRTLLAVDTTAQQAEIMRLATGNNNLPPDEDNGRAGNARNRTTTVTATDEAGIQLAGARAGITATQGDLNLLVGKNLVMRGADLKAAGNLAGQVDGDIEVSALELTNSLATTRSIAVEGGSGKRAATTGSAQTLFAQTTAYQVSTLEAGKGMTLTAGGDAGYTGTDLKSGGDMALRAGGDLTIRSDIAGDESLTMTDTWHSSRVRSATTQTGAATRQTLAGGNIDAGGAFTANAGKQLEAAGANILAGGDTALSGQTVKLGVQTLRSGTARNDAATTRSGEHGQTDETDQTNQIDETGQTHQFGTTIKAGGGISILATAPAGGTPATGIHMTSAQLQGDAITLATNGNMVIDSAQDSQGSDRHDSGHVATQSSVTTRAGRIDGTSVTLAGADINVTATDIMSTGQTRIAAAGNLTLGANTDSQASHTLDISHSSSFFNSKTTTDEHTRQSQTARVTTITAGQIALGADGDMTLLGSALTATDGGATLTAGGKIGAYAIQNQSYTNDSHDSTSSFMGFTYSRNARQDTTLNQTAQVTALQSTDSLTSQSGGDTLLQATRIDAPVIDIRAGAGAGAKADARVIIEGVKETTRTSHTETNSSLVWQKMQGEGGTTQTLMLANLNGNLSLTAPGGVIAQLPEGGFKTQLGQLAQQPGQAWLNQLAQRNDVDWQQVALAYDHWQYAHEGLSPVAALIIAVAVAVATQGAGTEMLGTMAPATGGGIASSLGGVTLSTTVAGTTTLTTAGIIVNAGFTSIINQAAIGLVNNKGNIGQTLSDLGSSGTVKQMLASMVTAGTTANFGSSYGIERVAAETVAGCASGELTGAGCEKGATFAATTSTTAWFYNSTVGYDAYFGPGRNPEDPFYEFVLGGRQPVETYGNNVTGFNEAGYFCSQGSTCSKLLNNVPFVNATAGFHDYIFNAGWLTQGPISNFAAMLPSAFISIPATLNGTTLLLLTHTPP